MIDYSRVWEFIVWGLTVGFFLAFLMWLLGIQAGVPLRWIEFMMGRTDKE